LQLNALWDRMQDFSLRLKDGCGQNDALGKEVQETPVNPGITDMITGVPGVSSG